MSEVISYHRVSQFLKETHKTQGKGRRIYAAFLVKNPTAETLSVETALAFYNNNKRHEFTCEEECGGIGSPEAKKLAERHRIYASFRYQTIVRTLQNKGYNIVVARIGQPVDGIFDDQDIEKDTVSAIEAYHDKIKAADAAAKESATGKETPEAVVESKPLVGEVSVEPIKPADSSPVLQDASPTKVGGLKRLSDRLRGK